MNKKDSFVRLVNDLLEFCDDTLDKEQQYVKEGLEFYNAFKETKDKPKFTDNGKLILSYLKEHKDDYDNLFKAKDIAAGIGINSKAVSGSIRKLCSDGYIERIGENPVLYSLTADGETINIEE